MSINLNEAGQGVPLPEQKLKEPAYTDTDLMHFGKHKDLALQDVPAKYLHWLYTEGTIHDVKLLNYIENSLSALKEEYPDGIWTKKGK